jgi:glycosyltransferase involved in cell wall biosynthesis
LYTGVLERFQRIDYLLAAMAIVSRSAPDAVLVIAGNIKNDEAIERYSKLAARLRIADRVKFVRSVPLDVLPDYLAMADVAVISRPNCPGYPIKLLNYVAAAKPVVSFAGSAKSLCHGYSGYVAENDNVEDLARGIKLFLDDSEMGSRIGAQARESMKEVFDWTCIARGTAEVYRCVIEDRRHVSRKRLARYFKASYNPKLSNIKRLSDFELDGVVSYPSLVDPESPDHESLRRRLSD